MSGLRRGLADWLDRPAGLLVTVGLILVLLAAPAWLLADSLRAFKLFGDDFIYIAQARDAPRLLTFLFQPHNTHVVPLFRLWTYLLVCLSGRLEIQPDVFGAASYAGLVVAMLAVGLFVGRETRDPAIGLAALGLTGITTVIASAVTWYSAGQALWAGTVIVLTLLAVQSWCLRPSPGWLALAILGVFAAPAVWTGGLVAGPAALLYLAARRRPRAGPAQVLLALATLLAAALLLLLARDRIEETGSGQARPSDVWPRPIQASLNTAQAIPEVLVFHNLGLDAATTPVQGVVFTLGLLALAGRHGLRPGRIDPLILTGGGIVLFSYLLVFFFRANYTYDSLRPIVWYNLIPHVGAVLVATGWWSAHARPSVVNACVGASAPWTGMTRRRALVLVGLAGVLVILQEPRALRILLADAPALTPAEAAMFPIPELQRQRALYLGEAERARQRRALAGLDRAERRAARLGIGRAAMHAAFGRVLVPGLPERQTRTDAVDLLALPEGPPGADPDRLRAALGPFLRPEPEPVRPWLDPNRPWPP